MTTDSTAAGPSSPAAAPSLHQARQFEGGVGCSCGKPWPHTDARLRELENAATPGPWVTVMTDWSPGNSSVVPQNAPGVIAVEIATADAALIAAARNALPLLLDVADAARALLTDQDSLESGCGTCGGTGVAWDWPAHTDFRAALAALDAKR